MISINSCRPAAVAPGAQADPVDSALTSRDRATQDTELVRRFNTGDERALGEIMSRHRQRLFSVAFAMLKNQSDADEIVQDTFIRAHRGLANFRGDSSLITWLHHITLNLARNRYWYFYRRRRHATVSLDSPLNGSTQVTFADFVATGAAGPAQEVVTSEFTSLIASCMNRLSAPHSEILTLRNTLNRSYAEIAHELSITVGTVKSRIARARECLRELLASDCPEFGSAAKPMAWLEATRPSSGIEPVCA
jgi:RNA polymerase sigma-70 factor, ECF subfamily